MADRLAALMEARAPGSEDIDALARYYAKMPTKLDDLAHHEQGD